MNTAAKLLTNNGDNPFHPLHIIFVRMVASTALGFTYTWYRRVPDAPLGPRNIRHLLLLRGLTGFVGLWGTYCECPLRPPFQSPGRLRYLSRRKRERVCVCVYGGRLRDVMVTPHRQTGRD